MSAAAMLSASPTPRFGRRSPCDPNLARLPIWVPRGGDQGPSSIYGAPCSVAFAATDGEGVQIPPELAGPRTGLTSTDLRIYLDLLRRWDIDGRPSNGKVHFGGRELWRTIGMKGWGLRQVQLVEASLIRLKTAAISSAVRGEGTKDRTHIWGLIDEAEWARTDTSAAWVALSSAVTSRIAGGRATWVDLRAYDQIHSVDQLAARLWLFLEAEKLERPWHYAIWADPRRGAPENPPVAELLRLRPQRARDGLRTIRRAAGHVMDQDPRYVLEVRLGGRGAWELLAERRQREAGQHPHDTVAGLPRELVEAWRRRYDLHLPSRRQATTVTELLNRWTLPEAVAILASASGDPLDEWMARDRDRSTDRLAAADVEDAAWAATKREEERTAAAGFAQISELLAQLGTKVGPACG